MKHSFFLFIGMLASTMFIGCSGATDVYHVGSHSWQGDSIAFRVYQTSDSNARPSLPNMTVACLSCNFVNAPLQPAFDGDGVAKIFVPEAIHDLSARLHVNGSGIDTTFIQKQRPPQEATAYYQLSSPLVGRILVEQLALLYTDTTQETVVTNAQTGDELNIFSETPVFYLVHDPLFSQPLYLLKSNAMRLY